MDRTSIPGAGNKNLIFGRVFFNWKGLDLLPDINIDVCVTIG